MINLRNTVDLGRGALWPLVCRLAVPTMLAQIVSVLYSIVDRMYIGNIDTIGGLALAGVGVCGPITTLLSSFASLVGLGGAPILAMRLGEGSGCPLAFQVLEAACAVMNDMATFEQAGIDDGYLDEIRQGDSFTVPGRE